MFVSVTEYESRFGKADTYTYTVVALVFGAASSLIAFVLFVGSFWEQLVSRWYQTTYILVPYGVRYFLVPNKPPRSF